MVIVGRIVQAAGASVIPAIAMIVPVRYFLLKAAVVRWVPLQSDFHSGWQWVRSLLEW